MKMTFGKYKGQEVENIPTSYILWALENTTMGKSLEDEMQSQLQAREGEGIVRKGDGK